MKHLIQIALCALPLMIGTAAATAAPAQAPVQIQGPAYQEISPEQAKAMREKAPVVVVDVRTAAEYAEGHIQGAVNVPLHTIEPGMRLAAAPDVNQPVLIYCRSGRRAFQAGQILVRNGYRHVYNFGGVIHWPYGLVRD